MLYGGPLGTYLSGISTASAVNQPQSSSTGYPSSSYTSPNYLGGGLRRTTSKYRSNASVSSGLPSTSPTITSNSTRSTSPSLSSYYTPQVRRKYAAFDNEPTTKTTGRYHSRTPIRSPIASNSPASSTVSTTSSTSSSVSDNTSTGLRHYLRRSPSKSGPTTVFGTGSSWNSEVNAGTSDSVDYKRLYEEEKVATDELRAEIASAQKETRDLQGQIDSALRTRHSSNTEQRKLERRISECEEELKLLEKLRAESEKLRAEHRALVRVVSRLNREQ